MSKFLNETGLKHFWDKIKEYFENILNAFADNVVIKNEDITIVDEENFSSLTLTGNSILFAPDNGPSFALTKEKNESVKMVLGGVEIEAEGNIGITDIGPNGTELFSSFTSAGFGVSKTSDGKTTSVNISADEGIYISNEEKTTSVSLADEICLSANDMYGNFRVSYDSSKHDTELYMGNVEMHSNSGIIKAKGLTLSSPDRNQVFVGDGSTIEINSPFGIPTLNENGKLDASMVDIDNTLFEVVAALPTTGIKESRIYLVPSEKKESNNTYIEYIYTGDVNAAYDAAKWEKLGEYTADIDLTPYASKANIVDGFAIIGLSDKVVMDINMDDENTNELEFPLATIYECGAMSAADKRFIDIFSARYPLKIASFTATPSLLEVGAQADINFAWGYENNDLHEPDLVQIKTLEGDNITIIKSATSYKEQSVTGATTAATKTATLTVKYGDKTVTRSVNLTYHYPSYIGVVANGAAIDEATVKALTKSVEWGKGKTAALTQANQKIVYAYPASYGDLTSIKDGNGFQGFAGYTKQTLTIGGQAYNVYVQNLPATSSSTYTFA